MVTSRRKPVAPAPGLGSRTNSSQPIQRSAKAKSPDGVLTNGRPSQLSKESDVELSKTTKSKDKHKKKKKRSRERSLIHMLSRITVLLTTIYAYLACPNSPIYASLSVASNSPSSGVAKPLPLIPHPLLVPLMQTMTTVPPPHPLVCKALLTTHNRLILPFSVHVLAPASHRISSLAHSAAYSPTLSPYTTATVQWYKGPVLRFYHSTVVPAYINVLVPVYHKHVLPRVRVYIVQPLWHEGAKPLWRHSIVPAYNRYVVRDLWQAQIMPLYKTYIHYPLAPYGRDLRRIYKLHILPALSRLASQSADVYTSHIEPALELAVVYAERASIRGYDVLQAAWKRIQPHLSVIWMEVDANGQILLDKVAKQRRIYVDRHVARIWAKVKELSGVQDSPPRSSSARPERVVDGQVIDIEAEYSSVVPQTVSDGPARSAASIIEESLLGVAPSATISSIAEPEGKTLASASATVNDSDNSDEGAESVTTDTPSETSILAESLPSGTASASDIDLDDFMAGLGIDSDSEQTQNTAEAPIPKIQESTPITEEEIEAQKQALAEQEALRNAETAEKRAAIEKRHKAWESQLETLVLAQEDAVRAAIDNVRREAASEVTNDGGRFSDLVDVMVKEGEKLVKGAAGWLTAHEKAPYSQAARGDPNFSYDQESVDRARERDERLFNQIVFKMEQKFKIHVEHLEDAVNGWLAEVRDREVAQVVQAEQEVKALADKAQADLGLDYAWLDDVTYSDWQRYHDLMRRSEAFSDIARSLQNGTHPEKLPDPLVSSLLNLQSEVKDIGEGFNVRLHQIKMSARRLFEESEADDDTPNLEGERDVDSGSPTEQVGAVDESTQDREPDNDVDEPEPEPAVSILPIPSDGDGRAADGAVADIPSVLVGRSAEEVVEALGRAADPAGRRASGDADEVGSEGDEGIGGEERFQSEGKATQSPAHVEL